VSSPTGGIQQRIQQRKAEVAAIRSELRQQRLADTTGLACTNWLSDRIDGFVCDAFRQSAELFTGSLSESWSLLAVGGNGRRRPAPFSDIDLLIRDSSPACSRWWMLPSGICGTPACSRPAR
jgi:UTP:GlnB (protein PII) uridylyltransferase